MTINYKQDNIIIHKVNYAKLKQVSEHLGCTRERGVVVPVDKGNHIILKDQADFILWSLSVSEHAKHPFTLQFIQGPNLFEFCDTQ